MITSMISGEEGGFMSARKGKIMARKLLVGSCQQVSLFCGIHRIHVSLTNGMFNISVRRRAQNVDCLKSCA